MTIWKEKTNKGRVIYDRKPHLWTDKDIRRIIKVSDVPFFEVSSTEFRQLMIATRELETGEPFEGFGGGGGEGFGGAGVTRGFDGDIDYQKILDAGIICIIEQRE